MESTVRLFADDCFLYRPITNVGDHIALQKDLQQLEFWAKIWEWFNAKNCYIMSINSKSSHFYQLDDHIQKQVPENPYLGITLSEDLKWGSHINKITKKANSTLGFLRRNLKHCPAPPPPPPPPVGTGIINDWYINLFIPSRRSFSNRRGVWLVFINTMFYTNSCI